MKNRSLLIKVLLITLGIIMLLIGFVLLFIPGPGLLFLFGGLVILAGHFVWARRALKRVKSESKKARKVLKEFDF